MVMDKTQNAKQWLDKENVNRMCIHVYAHVLQHWVHEHVLHAMLSAGRTKVVLTALAREKSDFIKEL